MGKDQKITVGFKFEKETKGAIRYQEIDGEGNPVTTTDGAKIGTLYLRKTALSNEVPQKLKVEISAA